MNAKRKVMDEAELRVLGIEALDKALVPAEALRFPAFTTSQRIMLRISKKLYEGQSN